ncbi:MAG: 3-methyl-2-oxobutanoate dehydrogenase subunit VorB [Kiritimatiellae bacterium]|nr:3-methyl-2-oxobutanoate dehydrogenase subunit VorB [Kiritimatiellia bacterium]
MTKFVKSNEAVVMGALYAGCDLYFGYPITPASEIAHGAAKWFPMLGRTFVQAECETASINMMFGAAGAGKLCMTATSGPGFSLMQEGISYLAGAELPAVIVDINRAGPGLGNVYPEQSDYTPAVKGGGHGNYRTFTLAPASAQEMCDFTIKAFQMAAKWRTPAVVFADGLQGQMMETVKLPDAELPRPDFSGWAAQGEPKTRQNLVKSIFLDAAAQEVFNDHLQRKYEDMAADAMAETYLAYDADLLIVAFGIASRIARTTAETLRRKGLKAGVFRPLTLNPFPRRQLADAIAGGARSRATAMKIMTIELDAGQFADDVRLNLAKAGLGAEAANVMMIHRMGGQVVTVDDAVKAAKMILGK